MPSKQAFLSLYKSLIREGNKLDSYNYRNYVLRKVRDTFRENKNKMDEEQYMKGIDSLQLLKRQTLIGNMFKTDKLIIEKP